MKWEYHAKHTIKSHVLDASSSILLHVFKNVFSHDASDLMDDFVTFHPLMHSFESNVELFAQPEYDALELF